MAHARQQVRDAAERVLAGSTSGHWRHVFKTRITPTRDIYPYLLVYIDSESSATSDIHGAGNFGGLFSRSMALTIRGFLKITDDELIEEKADDMAEEIEKTLTNDALNSELGSKLKSLELQSSSFAIETDETERTAGVLSLDWIVRVFTIEGTPQTLV